MTNTYYEERRPVRKLPHLTEQQIIAAAQRHAIQEARGMQEPSTHHIGSSAGFHPEEDYELEEDERYYDTRPHTSTRRYQGYEISPEHVFQSGNKRYHVRVANIPPRKSRQAQLPPQHQRPMYTNEVETPVPQAGRHKRRIHPLLTLGVGMLAMAAIFLLLSSVVSWFQIKQDDLTYGRPRTFQTDAVVGHNDSPANPSHFIAINLNRHIEVIEQPGGDSSKMRVFNITTLFGDGQDLTPITVSFRDLTGNGKLDMLIHIQGTDIAMINENGTFRPAKPGEVKGQV